MIKGDLISYSNISHYQCINVLAKETKIYFVFRPKKQLSSVLLIERKNK